MDLKTVVITPSSHPSLDDLLTRHPHVDNFYFERGHYVISKPLVIDRENVVFAGLHQAPDVHITQTTSEKDALVIRASRVSVHHLSVHCEEGSGIAITHADVSWTSIEHCHIYGSETYFAVYMAGSTLTPGPETLQGYNDGVLDQYNVFDNNVVYSKWSGDAISFSLQRYGSVRNNVVRGGQFSIYMVRDCVVPNNHVYDSSSYGIGISLPSHDVIVSNNHIEKCQSSGIAMRPQLEHGEFDKDVYNITVQNNVIENVDYLGIEVTDVSNVVVKSNYVRRSKDNAVYILRSDNVRVEDNRLSYFPKGIMLDVGTHDTVVYRNRLFSIYPDEAVFGVWMEVDVHDNSVTENSLYGHYSNTDIKDLGTENTNEGNIVYPYIESLVNMVMGF